MQARSATARISMTMLIATLLLVAAEDGWAMKFDRRCVKKKNGLSSVDAVTLQGFGRDRHQAVELLAIVIGIVPARDRQQPAWLEGAIEIAPGLDGVETVFRQRQTSGRGGGPGVDQRDLHEVVAVWRMID